MTYAQSVDFGAGTKVTLRWQDFKAIVVAKYLQTQYVRGADAYLVFAVDGHITYFCALVYGANSPDYPFGDDYSQTQNDADTTDFQTNVMPWANKAIEPRTSDGKYRHAAEKALLTRTNFYSHNFCDPTTWYQQAVRKTGQTATAVAGSTVIYQLPDVNLIDMCHGKVVLEDYPVTATGSPLTVLTRVYVSGTKLTERPFPATTGGDYTLNYATGTITFAAPPTGPVTADYSCVNTALPPGQASRFTIEPYPGKKFTLSQSKTIFTTDIVMTDAIHFEIWGMADFFYPPSAIGTGPGQVPSGTKVCLQPFVYKTMMDFITDAHDVSLDRPGYGPAGHPRSAMTTGAFTWEYVASSVMHSMYGTEIRAFLEHDTPLGGTSAVSTLYCLSESEP